MGPAVVEKRVVVTGRGVRSPLGRNAPEAWNNAVAGVSGISLRTIGEEDFTPDIHVAGEIKDFQARDELSRYISGKALSKAILRTPRSAHLMLVAGGEALENANLYKNGTLTGVNQEDIGVIVGSGSGGQHHIIDAYKHIAQGDPIGVMVLKVELEVVASALSRLYKLKAHASASVAACASSLIAANQAIRMLLLGEAKVMLVGGTESALTPTVFKLFREVDALSKSADPERASLPLDEDRDGFVMAEGASALIYEDREHADKRNATPLAEVVGYADASEAYDEIEPEPEGEGLQRTIKEATKNVDLTEGELLVVGHFTGTPKGDFAEFAALKAALPHTGNIFIYPPKWNNGHQMGGAGTKAGVDAVEAMLTGIIPATRNIRRPMNVEPFRVITDPKESANHNIEHVLFVAAGFGGLVAANLLKRIH